MLSKEAKIIQGMFQISTKEGPRVPFKLNTFQLWLDEMIHDPDYHSFILAKPRQKGGSSYIEGILTTRCLGKIGTRAVVMSHEGEATQRLLDKVHFYLKYTQPAPAYERNSRNELAFGKTDSTFYIGTAGARAFGRGDTITDLHCCIHPDTWVLHDNKAVPIKEVGVPTLINYSGEVVRVVPWMSPQEGLTLTPEHKVLTPRGLVRADELNIYDKIIYKKRVLTQTLEAVPGFDRVRVERGFGKGKGSSWENVPFDIPLTYEFGRVCGLFLAEGTLCSPYMTIALHKKETDLVDWLKEYFGEEEIRIQEHSRDEGIEVYIKGVKWHNTFLTLFGGGEDKHLPDWVFDAPTDFLFGLVEGVFRGDGWIHYTNKTTVLVGIGQVRSQIIFQLRDLICSLGLGFGAVKCGYSYKGQKNLSWTLNLTGKNARQFMRVIYGIEVQAPEGNFHGSPRFTETDTEVHINIRKLEKSAIEGVTFYDLLDQPEGLIKTPYGMISNSEYGYWQDAVKHSVGLFQAVPASGFKILESTGNGRNNDFHYIWQHADRMSYKRLFAPWFIDLEYSCSLPYSEWTVRDADTQHLTYLINLQKKFSLSMEQMFWYTCKLAELRDDLHLMQQEYPSEPEECFQATSGSIFPDAELTPIDGWQDLLLFNIRMFGLGDHPKKDLHYVIGGDPSGGTGHDDAALIIFCVETFEQVLRFSSNTTDPVIFSKLLIDLGRLFNHAYITTESNNHGAAVIPILKRDYDRSLLYYYKRATTKSPAKYGWLNNPQHKQELVGNMQEMLDQFTFYDKKTTEELQKFEEDAEGKMGAKSDNLVIAAGLGMLGCMKQIRYRTDYLTPPPPLKEKPSSYMYYTLDEALKSIEVQQRRSGYFKPQVQIGTGWVN